MRLLLLILISTTLALTALPAAAQQPRTTTISGGGFPGVIELTAADHDAFSRRLDLPPLFESAPEQLSSPGYTVTSSYWDEAIRDGDDEQARVEDTAVYYPNGGFVRTRQGTNDVWTALNTEQRAILDRYIRLKDDLVPSPTALQLLQTAAAADEVIGIRVGPFLLTPEQRQQFWQLAAAGAEAPMVSATATAQPQRLSGIPGTTWIIFSLAEGRTIQMLYNPVVGTLIEPVEQLARGSLTPVSADWLVPIFGDAARPSETFALEPLQVPQEEGSGSLIWWPIAIGGGLACIAVAVYLQRRFGTAA